MQRCDESENHRERASAAKREFHVAPKGLVEQPRGGCAVVSVDFYVFVLFVCSKVFRKYNDVGDYDRKISADWVS